MYLKKWSKEIKNWKLINHENVVFFKKSFFDQIEFSLFKMTYIIQAVCKRASNLHERA